MKALIKCGQEIGFLIKIPRCEPAPCFNEVLVVQQGALTVYEENSINGLAKIQIHGTSDIDGTYWYNYTDKKGKPVTEDILSLFDTHTSWALGKFIKE